MTSAFESIMHNAAPHPIVSAVRFRRPNTIFPDLGGHSGGKRNKEPALTVAQMALVLDERLVCKPFSTGQFAAGSPGSTYPLSHPRMANKSLQSRDSRDEGLYLPRPEPGTVRLVGSGTLISCGGLVPSVSPRRQQKPVEPEVLNARAIEPSKSVED